jgi:hypothetical protein
MFPANTIFPKFVPDQLLTSDNLNQLFGYLDEQGRMTRTNLIGIGIVCGLEVQTNTAGTSIKITKGCGVTSEGYLVTVPDNTYTEYIEFDPVKERYYDRFVNIATKTEKFDLWELKQAGVDEASIDLSAEFLKDKIVLIFVELKEEGNKNCDPNSCDDKGVNVTVTFRPLLVSKENADSLLGVPSSAPGIDAGQLLPHIKFRRYDVPFTLLSDTPKILNAYLNLFKDPFLTDLQTSLTTVYNVLMPIVLEHYPTNPFNTFASKFAFLANGSITGEQLLNIQYYYDLFSDLIQAYEELKAAGSEIISLCCPDSSLFPRHLLLGEALGSGLKSSYRHYFIASPALTQHHHLTVNLRFLFKKLVLLIDDFNVPPVQIAFGFSNRRFDSNIRITPSKLGAIRLSEKSIPYYYSVNEAQDPLFKNWSYHNTITGIPHRNLSYHASLYNTTDDEIQRPLFYELEPYNFFRIEGHLGKSYQHVLRNIQQQKLMNRLPFDVIALNADLRSLIRKLLQSGNMNATSIAGALNLEPEKIKCHFNDLEALYDTSVAELTCTLCEEIQYFYNLPRNEDNQLPPLESNVPKVQLLLKCAPGFRIRENSLGHEFEIFYARLSGQSYFSPEPLLAITGSNVRGNAKTFVFVLLYYMEKLYEVLTASLKTFDAVNYQLRHSHLLLVARHLKDLLKKERDTQLDDFTEDIIDHLDALIFSCDHAKFKAIYQEYLSRWMYLLLIQSFGYYTALNPGITHKAGVPVGGTFILVYHQKEVETPDRLTNITGVRTDILSSNAIKNVINKISERMNLRDVNLNITDLAAVASNEGDRATAVDELIREWGDGIVFADFYLPYLCCSDCPPVQFVIPDREQPVPSVSLALEPNTSTQTNEYCSNDERSYLFTATPDGGDIEPKDGVDKNAAGQFIFTPAKVNIDNNLALSFDFVYNKDGQSSSAVKATVYHKPQAEFTTQVGTPPTVIHFQNTSRFATAFEWDFGDGSKDTTESPTHTYQQEGLFTVTLKATNGVCSDTFTGEVQVSIPVEKTCMPLNTLIEDFRALESIQPDRFDPFRDLFGSYQVVEGFYGEMNALVFESTERQIEFFAERRIAALLNRWLKELVQLFSNVDIRLLSFAMYRILVNLAMYIACIQAEDINKAKVNLSAVFKLIGGHIDSLAPMVANMMSEEREQWRILLGDITAQLNQVIANGEESTKQNYVKALKKCIELLTSFNL